MCAIVGLARFDNLDEGRYALGHRRMLHGRVLGTVFTAEVFQDGFGDEARIAGIHHPSVESFPLFPQYLFMGRVAREIRGLVRVNYQVVELFRHTARCKEGFL